MIRFFTSILSILLFLSLESIAQNNKSNEGSRYYLEIDRLLNSLESAQYDSNQVKILNKLSWIYKTSNPSKAIDYAQKALNIADSIDYAIGMASAYNYLGAIHNLRGDYQRSLGKFLEDARLYQAIREQVGVAQFYKRGGVNIKDNEDYKKALGYYKKSLMLAVGLRDSSRIASPLNNIGKLYKYLEEYDKSLEYFEKALKIYDQKKDSTLIAITINNIGETYEFQNQLKQAIEQYKRALRIAKEKNNGGQIAVFSNHLANAYQKDGNTLLSEFHALESLKYAQQYRKNQEILTISHLLAQIYVQKGQYDRAYEFEVLHSEMLNTLSKERESQRITQIQELFEAEQNRTRLQLLRKDKKIEADSKELQRSYTNLVWIVLAFISIFTLVLYRSYINSKRANLTLTEQNERIYQQNQEIALQKDNIELSNIELMRKNELIEKKSDSYQQLLKELNEKNTYLTHSIRYAEKIQRSFLPHISQFKDSFRDYFVIFKPKDVVSGDFYWLSRVEDQIFLAIVDCTGHGVPGAFMSMIGNTLLNEIINQEKIFNTNEILEQLHDGVRWSLKQNNSQNTDGMDIALCRIEAEDDQNLSLQFSGAKRSLYFVHEGKLDILAGDRKSIGGWQNESQRTFTEQKIQLKIGDRLYFHTDGYPDAPNAQRKKIGRKRMESIINENLNISLKEQGALLLYELYQHKGNTEQRDDITFIGVEL